jgi:ATP-dependent Clp protease adaptor protein ClpS
MLDEPKRYKVLLHNDDYTTMDFVVEILMDIFHKNELEAQQIMLTIHKSGKAVCGVYTYDIAQTKVYQVKELAKKNSFPLLATLEDA